MFWLLIAKGKNYRRDEDYQSEHKLDSLNFMRKTGSNFESFDADL